MTHNDDQPLRMGHADYFVGTTRLPPGQIMKTTARDVFHPRSRIYLDGDYSETVLHLLSAGALGIDVRNSFRLRESNPDAYLAAMKPLRERRREELERVLGDILHNNWKVGYAQPFLFGVVQKVLNMEFGLDTGFVLQAGGQRFLWTGRNICLARSADLIMNYVVTLSGACIRPALSIIFMANDLTVYECRPREPPPQNHVAGDFLRQAFDCTDFVYPALHTGFNNMCISFRGECCYDKASVIINYTAIFLSPLERRKKIYREFAMDHPHLEGDCLVTSGGMLTIAPKTLLLPD